MEFLQNFANHVENQNNFVKHEMPERVRIPVSIKSGPEINASFEKRRELVRLSNEITDMMMQLCEKGRIHDLVAVADRTFVDHEHLAPLCTVLFTKTFFDGDKSEFGNEPWSRLRPETQDYYITIMKEFHAKVTEVCAKLRLAGRVLQSSFNDTLFTDHTL